MSESFLPWKFANSEANFVRFSLKLGVLGIYGLITAVIINGKLDTPAVYSSYSGYAHLGAGLTVGMSSLAAGLAIGIVGDAGVRANAQQPKLYVGMILILIFAEALGLYGLIVGLVVASTASEKGTNLCSSYAP
jgi:V-type H+-transporting ATPase proteolipid subunit